MDKISEFVQRCSRLPLQGIGTLTLSEDKKVYVTCGSDCSPANSHPEFGDVFSISIKLGEVIHPFEDAVELEDLEHMIRKTVRCLESNVQNDSEAITLKRPQTKLILISGHAQHGKDTTASFMKEYFEEHRKKTLIVHYGDLLKWECSKFFGWNGEKDEHGRSLLQRVGTNLVRGKDPDYWADFLIRTLQIFDGEWDYVLIPDCRFPNEVDKPAEVFDAIHIRVFRENFTSPLTEEQQNHPSETALNGHPYDIGIVNDEGLAELREVVRSCSKNILENDW